MYRTDYQQHQRELARFKEVVISLESNMFSDVAGQMSGLLSDIGVTLTNKIKDIKYYIAGLPEDPNIFFSQLDYLESKLDKINYVDIREKIVPIPQGFKGDYEKYINYLIPLVREIKTNADGILKDYIVLISSIINNGSDKVILTNYNKLYAQLATNRKKIDTETKAFFDGNRTVAKIGELIPNMATFKKVNRDLVTLLNSINKKELIEMNDQVNTIHDLLELLVKKLKDNKLVMNKADILDVSNGAYEVASYLETIALTYYTISEVINRLKDLIVTILKG